MKTLDWKPNFAETIERFGAWWRFEPMDRPVMSFSVAARDPLPPPRAGHATVRERWWDVEYQVRAAEWRLSGRAWPAESLPVFMPNLGPDLVATVMGCELEFGEHTSWAKHTVENPGEWRAWADRAPDFHCLAWKTIEAMTRRGLEVAAGRFLVGIPDLHGAFDLLAALRGPERLCVDLVDDPEAVAAAAAKAADVVAECFERAWAWQRAAGWGSTTWTAFYHPGPAYVSNCDFWCLVSGGMAEEFILPTIRRELAPLERSIFHLDGPTALRHLPLVLGEERIQAVQWVFGAGNGPASKWLDVYKRCLAAGRSVQVFCEGLEDARTCARELGSRGVWLSVWHEFPDAAAGERFMAEIAALAKSGG